MGIRHYSLKPTAVTYRTLIGAVAQGRQADLALELLQQVRGHAIECAVSTPRLPSMLHWEGALSLLAGAGTEGRKLDWELYSRIAIVLLDAGREAEAMCLYR